MMPRVPRSKRTAPRARAARAAPPRSDKKPELAEFLKNKDYVGAVTLLEFQKRGDEPTVRELMWLGYSAMHLGDYKKAADVYDEVLAMSDAPADAYTYKACCLYYLQLYEEAMETANKGPATELQNRVLFHCAHRVGDETKLLQYHQRLTDSINDQLSLAAIHCLRSHFQEATDIYKRLLLENRDFLALNVYVSMCYYKLDYYDVSLEILNVYLQTHANSVVAINLKACNNFRLFNGKAAEAEYKTLVDQGQNLDDLDIVRHNLVVFRQGEGAQQTLPGLVDYIPEARLNLVIYHLRNDDVNEAHELIKDVDPTIPQEYILKGVVHSMMGQSGGGSRDHLRMAQQFFQLVGASASECDTIPGRQCMASCFFLLRQFEDVNIYLSSIKSYMYNDDDFNWNYGTSLAAVGNYKEAEETLLLVQSEKLQNEYSYLSWLARCYIMNKKPRQAWELYLRMDTGNDSFNLLQLIANDCYKMGQFYFAAKAFDVLERLDPDPEYWEGKRGACMGVFQQFIARQESKESLREVLVMLRNTSNPQVEYIVRTVQKWCQANGMSL